MTELKVSLFGRITIERNGIPISDLPSSKAQELLSYLLLHPRSHPREKLASLLWPEAHHRTKAYLRKALWHLRQGLGTHEGCPIVLTEGDWMKVHPEADVWVDVSAFEAAFDDVRDASISEMSCDEVADLEKAVDLYKGDLLENWYHDWCLMERERIRDMYLRALDRLTRCCENRGAYDSGIKYGLTILRIDPARERAHRQLMRLRARSGDRVGALRQYQQCAEVLERELGVRPSSATRQLHQRIRAEEFPPAHSSTWNANPVSISTSRTDPPSVNPEPRDSGSAQGVSTDAASLRSGLERIRELQNTLASVQKQLRHDYEAVEVALRDRQ